eukprot:SAG31_NODE_33252_length_346_cov_0.611336_2_plen_69_part_00
MFFIIKNILWTTAGRVNQHGAMDLACHFRGRESHHFSSTLTSLKVLLQSSPSSRSIATNRAQPEAHKH